MSVLQNAAVVAAIITGLFVVFAAWINRSTAIKVKSVDDRAEQLRNAMAQVQSQADEMKALRVTVNHLEAMQMSTSRTWADMGAEIKGLAFNMRHHWDGLIQLSPAPTHLIQGAEAMMAQVQSMSGTLEREYKTLVAEYGSQSGD